MRDDPNRVKEIFLEAVEQPDEAARLAYLNRACGNDAELRNRVEALLRSHRPADSFLANPAAVLAAFDQAAKMELDSCLTSGPPITHDDEQQLERLQFLTPATRADSLGRIGHYEVLEVLGKGGFGIVFRAFDEKLQRAVAVKVLAPELAVTSPARKRFLREARSSAQIRHEYVVQIYAVEEQPLPYLVMELIPGETLQQRLDRTGPLETLECLEIGRQIAEGLAAAHATGLIHRDIKPTNILLESGPRLSVKITDFGLARAVDDASVTKSGVVAGTPMYMAPEQAQGDKLDHRADLFSLGSVLYAMCSGRPPFRGKSTLAVLKRVAEDTPRPIPEIIPEAPLWLCEIINRLHAKNPDDRIATSREVANLLARGLAAIQVPGNVPSFPEFAPAVADNKPREGDDLANTVQVSKPVPAIRPRSRVQRWAAAAAVLLLLLCGIGFAEATGVTDMHGTVIRLLSAEGTLVVEVEDPGVSVKIDGSDVVITGAGVNEIRVKSGSHTVEASKGGKVFKQELVTVTKNGRQVVRVSQEARPPDLKVATQSPEASAWEHVVAMLSPAEQVKAVSARLKELNPGFDGAVVPMIEDGVLRGLQFNADDVSDISPVRALTKLRSLNCSGKGDRVSPLIDLSPLNGMPLTTLIVGKGQLSDLSPLKGMPLIRFSTYSNLVDDLSPLQGMKLRHLVCANAGRVSDLSPLRGMPLETLDLIGSKVKDLTPLSGMKLEKLYLGHTKVKDLTVIASMNIEDLDISGTMISDLSQLRGLNLTHLSIAETPVSDLSPIKGMKLTWMTLSGAPVSDLSPVNGMPLKEFNCAASKVTDASLAQLKDCNDLVKLVLFDTQVTDAGLIHLTDHKNLKTLVLYGSKVSDLAPLKEMSLDTIILTPKSISAQGLDVLRNMKSLETIGPGPGRVLPTAEFWARYAKGEFKD